MADAELRPLLEGISRDSRSHMRRSHPLLLLMSLGEGSPTRSASSLKRRRVPVAGLLLSNREAQQLRERHFDVNKSVLRVKFKGTMKRE